MPDFLESIQAQVGGWSEGETPSPFVGKYRLRRYNAVLHYYICTKLTGESSVWVTYDPLFIVRHKMVIMGYKCSIKEVCRGRYLAEERKKTKTQNPLLKWTNHPSRRLRSTNVN